MIMLTYTPVHLYISINEPINEQIIEPPTNQLSNYLSIWLVPQVSYFDNVPFVRSTACWGFFKGTPKFKVVKPGCMCCFVVCDVDSALGCCCEPHIAVISPFESFCWGGCCGGCQNEVTSGEYIWVINQCCTCGVYVMYMCILDVD